MPEHDAEGDAVAQGTDPTVRPGRGASRPDREERAQRLGELADVARRLQDAVNAVVEGKPEVVRTAVTVLLAGGHLLLEDVPGVGKTVLAKTLGQAMGATTRRIQFTPDLLPSDVTGVSVFHQERHEFEFRPGAIFANVVIGDEINRASPKTQSALLECMEEGQVSVDGRTHLLPRPFIVVATQNPVEMEGTYPLPEAQRDRFMARVSIGYPSQRSEVAMLEHHGERSPLADLRPVTDATTVARLVETTTWVHAAPALRQYVVDLATATRTSNEIALGASPRATLHLLRAARARAAVLGRPHVLPEDVQGVAVPVLAHRILLSPEGRIAGHSAETIVEDLLRRVPVPAPAR